MWSTSQPVTVNITDDQLQQGNRSFSLVLSIKPTNLSISENSTRKTITITIVDDGESNIQLIYKLLIHVQRRKEQIQKISIFSF